MPDNITKILLVGFVVLLTHCLEGITGFGCTVLALPFIILLIGIKSAVPILVVLAWILAGYIIIRSWKHIKLKEFIFIILHVAIGLPFGIYFFNNFSEHILKLILCIFMLCVGIWGLVKNLKSGAMGLDEKGEKSLLMRGILILGGMIHGAFGTGGPFVVVYASKALPQKALFRVTLCLLWFTLNTIMMLRWSIAGNVWNDEIKNGILVSLPFLLGGILLGDYLHYKVNERVFRIIVYAVLLASGFVMGYSTLT